MSSLSCPPFPFSFFAFVIIFRRSIVGFSVSLFLSLPRSFLTSTDKENMFTLDHFPVWYRRAAENPPGKFLYYMPQQETRGRGHTLIEQTHTQNTFCAFFISSFLSHIQQVEPKISLWHFLQSTAAHFCLLCIFM